LNYVDAGSSGGDIGFSEQTIGVVEDSWTDDGRPKEDLGFTVDTYPGLKDPVMKEWGSNFYSASVENLNISNAIDAGFEVNSVVGTAEAVFVVGDGGLKEEWNNDCFAYEIDVDQSSEALDIGIIPFNLNGLGLDTEAFKFDLSELGYIEFGEKVQAERYNRMKGLWREGSMGLNPGPVGFAEGGGYAKYENVGGVDENLKGIVVRVSTLGLAVSDVEIGFSINAPRGKDGSEVFAVVKLAEDDKRDWTEVEVNLENDFVAPKGGKGVTVFMSLSNDVMVDWFKLK